MFSLIFGLLVCSVIVICFVIVFISLFDLDDKIKYISNTINTIKDTEKKYQETIDNLTDSAVNQIENNCHQTILNYFNDLDKNGRCKKCNRICLDRSKFCPGCGEPFFVGNDQDIRARLLTCIDDVQESDDGFTVDFSWECLDCHEDHDEEVDLHEDLEKERIIYKLKCNSCDEFVGEVLIEAADDKVTFSEVYKTGTLKINHEHNKYTKRF
jgi:hypothetical protein